MSKRAFISKKHHPKILERLTSQDDRYRRRINRLDVIIEGVTADICSTHEMILNEHDLLQIRTGLASLIYYHLEAKATKK